MALVHIRSSANTVFHVTWLITYGLVIATASGSLVLCFDLHRSSCDKTKSELAPTTVLTIWAPSRMHCSNR